MKRYIKSSYDFYKKYEIKVDGGVLQWSMDSPKNPCIWVHGIKVDEDKQGQGIGTELMHKIIQIADYLGVPIELQPAPIGNKAMTVQQLTSWYEKLGFKKWVGCMRYEGK